jgi:hypothetical protein
MWVMYHICTAFLTGLSEASGVCMLCFVCYVQMTWFLLSCMCKHTRMLAELLLNQETRIWVWQASYKYLKQQ